MQLPLLTRRTGPPARRAASPWPRSGARQSPSAARTAPALGSDVRLEAVEQLAPRGPSGDRRAHALERERPCRRPAPPRARPRTASSGCPAPARSRARSARRPRRGRPRRRGRRPRSRARRRRRGRAAASSSASGSALSSTRRSRTVSQPSPAAGHDEQRRRLAPADVAAGRLGGVQRGQQAPRERPAGALVGARHRRPDLRARPSCSPARVKPSPAMSPAWAMQRSPVWQATRAARVDDRDLAVGRLLVVREQRGERRRRRPRPAASAVEQPRPVGRLGDRLRRDGADAGARPGDDRPDGEPVRLDGDADLAARGVARDDRVGAAAHRRRRYQRLRRCGSLRARGQAAHDPSDRARRRDAVLDRVAAIPEGFVRTYGDVSPGAPRFSGSVLSAHGDRVPWHRVVRADGSLAQGERQRALLDAEGVPIVGRPRRPARGTIAARCGSSVRSRSSRARAAATSSRARCSTRCPRSPRCGSASATC